MDENKKMEDEEIVLLIQNGEKEKFGILMDRYEKKISRYASKFLADVCNVEDIVQDLFIKVYENIMSFDTSMKFSPWIYRIAHNIFINEMKKKKTLSFHIFDIDTILPYYSYDNIFSKNMFDSEIKDIMHKKLDTLPLKYKEILILNCIEGFSYKEISTILKVPTGTVGIRLKRAKDLLRKQISFDILK